MIPVTKIHDDRVIEQIIYNLTGLQKDIRNNALSHRALVQAGTPVEIVAQYITDGCQSYLKRINWVLNADLKAIADWNYQPSDVLEPAYAMQAVVEALEKSPRGTADEIVAACGAVVDAVQPVGSLWPE